MSPYVCGCTNVAYLFCVYCLYNYVNKFEARSLFFTSHLKNINLIFHGITEPTNESGISCAKSVRKFMVDNLQISENAAAAVQFVRCHRINDSYRASTCKPVIVRFKNFSDRELIWSKKSVITNRNCNLSEDFPRRFRFP